MDYKISMIVPVYNARDSLDSAINSVINQSIGFENIELILVDDNSNDGSKEIIQEYADKYDNIVGVFLSENSGLPGKPRSTGIKYASAHYLMFLDADDEYVPNACEIYYNTIVREKSDFVMSSHFWNLDGMRMGVNIRHDCEDESDVLNFTPLLNEKNFIRLSYNHVAPWGKIYNKKVILENDIVFPEDILAEDTYFYFKTLINSKKVTYLPNFQLYIYNVIENQDSVIHTHDLHKFNLFLNGLIKVMDLLKDIQYSKERILISNIGSLLLMFSNLSRKDKKEAVLKIYEFEKSLNQQVIFDRPELVLLNGLILKKHFSLSIFVSDVYSMLYNNKTIKRGYRRFTHKKI
ncbi:Glycosyltransferase involved in cell wall bisynthesis [Methanobrevibacter gottschalkii]|uniref:Glycosyltransferase involved in cell wall bisynthesis n=1 Tax=Methanobrevibacter gottschalkii TaxID=190974 RepID=A0A1H7LU42_9EURY|nr:glycosyltransferase family 2 protein [Methanobrevibacter gottschalkii]SEL01837.1 Glycosyltransferase involved in cell wall bisynthesis [Methanobrevibacter gottschalkii]